MWTVPHQQAGGPVLLDGGLSNALADRGHDLAGGLWTARLLRDGPEEIAAVHAAYFEAGAQVATTASYQASVPGMAGAGLSRQEAEELLGRSVALAREVRDRFVAADGRPRWVAASVGPYGAALADGSEYRGRYGVSRAVLREFHLPRLEVLASAGPDLFAVETIPDADEAAVLVDLLDRVGLPAWFSYSVGTDATGRLCTRAGQPLEGAAALAGSAECVFAVGVNCCDPALVRPAVEVTGRATGRPGVAYPNSGEAWDPRSRGWTGAPSYHAHLAPAWVAAGAAYIGGCCRVGPEDIARLAAVLRTAPG